MQIRNADFDTDNAAIRQVRFTVFVDEQDVPADIELDDRDPVCVHLLALDADERPIGTGRVDLAAAGKIGRVAVLREARGTGVGTALMERLHDLARTHGLARVWCHAQISALRFYERLGYRATGEHFYEAGIEHVRMERDL